MGTDEKIEPYLVFVDVNGTTLQMEIDTGSALTLISQETFSKLWPQGEAPQLEKTSLRLRTYSGEELKVIGRAVVRVGCGGQVVEDLGLVVVGGKGPSLLGRDWLGKLQLDWEGDLNDSNRQRDTRHTTPGESIPRGSDTPVISTLTHTLQLQETIGSFVRCLFLWSGCCAISPHGR